MFKDPSMIFAFGSVFCMIVYIFYKLIPHWFLMRSNESYRKQNTWFWTAFGWDKRELELNRYKQACGCKATCSYNCWLMEDEVRRVPAFDIRNIHDDY